MKLDHDAGGIDKVVDVSTKFVKTADKVVDLFRNTDENGRKVGGLKTSTKICLLAGGALALCLFPLRLAYDSETGEGEYKSVLVGVKRIKKPSRSTQDKSHSVSFEMFPTVRVKPSDIQPCDLPPAQMKQPVKAVPMQTHRVQKAQVQVPVKLSEQKENV